MTLTSLSTPRPDSGFRWGQRVLPVLLCLMACLGLASISMAQPSAGDVFIDRVDVNVVNLEVFVTDRQGNRVNDLTADDFEVFEDGRPVEVTNFYTFVRPDQITTSFDSDRALVEGQEEEISLEAIPQDQRLALLIFIDNFNLKTTSRNRVLKQMRGFVEERLAQGDQISIMVGNRGAETVVPFSRSSQEIFSGFDKVRKMTGYRHLVEARRREVVRNVREIATFRGAQGGGPEEALQAVDAFVQESVEEQEQAIKTLRSVTRSLAGLPGRKAFMYVSDGLQELPGADLYDYVETVFVRGVLDDAGFRTQLSAFDEYRPELMQSIVSEANANQVTFYTVDARGSTGSGGFLDASTEAIGPQGGGTSSVDAIRTAGLQIPMIDMAERTGGTAIRNTINFDGALADLSQDFDSFYSLGYRSPRGGDGKYHRVEVKMRRPGLKARHRAGYVDKPQVDRVADRTLSSLLLDMQANPLDVGLDFGPAAKKGRNQYILPVIIRIPVRQLAVLPQGNEEQGKLSIFLAVRDEEGAISKIHQIPLPLNFPKGTVDTETTQEIAYRTNLQVRSGTPKVAVAVWDELSGTESFVHKRVLVGEKSKRNKRSERRDRSSRTR